MKNFVVSTVPSVNIVCLITIPDSGLITSIPEILKYLTALISLASDTESEMPSAVSRLIIFVLCVNSLLKKLKFKPGLILEVRYINLLVA